MWGARQSSDTDSLRVTFQHGFWALGLRIGWGLPVVLLFRVRTESSSVAQKSLKL